MDIRESLTNGNMPISKKSIAKSLQKVAKLVTKVDETVKPKASKSLNETIKESFNPAPEKIENKAEAVKPQINENKKTNTVDIETEQKALKEMFKKRMDKSLNESQREVSREIAMYGKVPGGRGNKFGETAHFFFPQDPTGRVKRRNLNPDQAVADRNATFRRLGKVKFRKGS